MAYVMSACGLLSLCFGGYVAATSVITDIQLGLVVTCVIGGVMLIGLGQLFDRIGKLEKR